MGNNFLGLSEFAFTFGAEEEGLLLDALRRGLPEPGQIAPKEEMILRSKEKNDDFIVVQYYPTEVTDSRTAEYSEEDISGVKGSRLSFNKVSTQDISFTMFLNEHGDNRVPIDQTTVRTRDPGAGGYVESVLRWLRDHSDPQLEFDSGIFTAPPVLELVAGPWFRTDNNKVTNVLPCVLTNTVITSQIIDRNTQSRTRATVEITLREFREDIEID